MKQVSLSRRSFLKKTGGGMAAGLGALALPGSDGAVNPGASGKPNIVYILADDMGYGDLGCFGQKMLRTPNIDRMAERGMRFTSHYAGSTVCAPSRCTLLTGLHTGHCRVRDNSPGIMKDSDVTVAHLLKRAGYATGCVGKWGVGNPPPLDDPKRMGFDYFYGYVSMWHAHNFYPEFLIENGERIPLRNECPGEWKAPDGRGVATKRVDYAPHLVTEKALQFIERNKKRNFFLYLALNVPHANNEGGKKGMEVPGHGPFAGEDWPEPEKGFAAMIRNIDKDVAKVLGKLRELELEKNTLVIFTSDNGPHQEGGHQHPFFDSNGPYRGFKRDLYEGGVRVPMIALWPGVVEPGAVSDHMSAFWDMAATFCELAGVSDLEKTDGISIVPTLRGETKRQKKHDFLYWWYPVRDGKAAVRMGRWKGVCLQALTNPGGPVELYDLEKDPGETNDIAAKRPDIVERIRKIMKDEFVPVGVSV